MKRIIAVITVALAICACTCSSDNSSESCAALAGTWLYSIPGQEGKQGFTLNADGSAESVNMATLRLEKWRYENGCLILDGQSTGNHQCCSASDTLKLISLSDNELVLSKGQLEISCQRK